MDVRRRADSDLDRCEALASAVRSLDGYPPILPQGLRRFLASPDALEAWVAEADERLLGHVALHRTTSAEVMALACDILGVGAASLAVVARLLVDPARRRRGIGRELLTTATDAALNRGLVTVLDVASHFQPAISLYEKHGWLRIGEVRVPYREQDFHEFVYVGPTRR